MVIQLKWWFIGYIYTRNVKKYITDISLMVIDCNLIVNWKSNKKRVRLRKQKLKYIGYWGCIPEHRTRSIWVKIQIKLYIRDILRDNTGWYQLCLHLINPLSVTSTTTHLNKNGEQIVLVFLGMQLILLIALGRLNII